MKLNLQDKIVQEVVNTILKRSDVGLKKYGTNLNRDDLTQLEWITHAQEEAMDMILYLEKMKQNLKTDVVCEHFDIGKRVKINSCIHGHDFDIGQIVEIVDYEPSQTTSWLCTDGTNSWWIGEQEADLY